MSTKEINLGQAPTKKEDLYYEITDGLGMKHKVYNMQNPLVCKRKGTIEIEALKRGKFKQPNVSFCTTFDKTNRIIYGIPIGIDGQTKKIIWKRFYIPDFKTYNLANSDEAEEWAIVRHHEVLNGARASYRIYDTEKIAQEEITQIGLIERAVGIAKDMKIKQWIPAARFFGKDPQGMSPLMLQSEIMKVAKDSPDELINYWENDNREAIDLFNAAFAVGLVSHDFSKGWLYKLTLPLGSTKDTAIRYVIKDHAFCKSLNDEVKSLDGSGDQLTDEFNENKKTSNDIEVPQELQELRIKAKLLGIKGYERMNFNTIKKRVEAAEKVVMNEIDMEETNTEV